MLHRVFVLTFFVIGFLSLVIDPTQVSAFAVSHPKSLVLPSLGSQHSSTTTTTTSSRRSPSEIRGGGTTTTSIMATNDPVVAVAAPPSPPPMKRIRITALDGIRFLLAIHIVMGHFLRYANPNDFLLRFFGQINVTVGAFFALSGYVTAYTTTEVGQRTASTKLTATPSQTWWLSKVMSYYPMHWLVLLLFSPMFIYSDLTLGKGGWPSTILNGLLCGTLTQAWVPMHAEVWNAPTWFLSSMTFSTALLPFCLPKIAQMDKRGLKKTGMWLIILKLLPILGYCLDNPKTWSIVEGITPPKKHPAYAMFNTQRFHPIFNVAEVLLGIIACRLVMLDSLEEAEQKKKTDGDNNEAVTTPLYKTNALSTVLPFVGLLTILTARAMNIVPNISDLLIRSILFTPLFLKFVMAAHRTAVAGQSNVLTNFLSSKTLVYMGGLSFPVFIVHGPIGQVFYKKLIAQKLWGGVLFGPQYFALYCGVVLISAFLLNKFILENSAVSNWSKQRVKQFSSWM